jgi:formylmethanofuran dehydrogenase subunit E
LIMKAEHPQLEELTAFHGHLCPGLAIGYRATQLALELLGIERAHDEELVAIVENDSCSVDAVQYLAGTTFGKGNFIFRDYGKQVFTFARRDEGKAVRISLKPGAFRREGSREERIEHILTAPAKELFEYREVELEMPPAARIHPSVTCDRCGEPVMATRTVERNGATLCLECDRNDR